MCVTYVAVSVANNFVHLHTASDYRYHSFDEVARSIYCLLRKIKQGSSLALVEQWDQYVLANHSKLPSIADEEFLSETHVLVALNQVGGNYLKKSSVGTLGSSWRDLRAPWFQSLLPDPLSGMEYAVSALQLLLVGMTRRHFICLACCLIDFWRRGGSGTTR